MDYSFLAGLGAGITGGNQGFNQAQQREYEGEQQEFENRRQQALLGLALAKQQLDEQNAANTQQNALASQAHANRQLDLQTKQQQQNQQEQGYKDVLQYPGMRLTPEQMANIGATPGTARAATFKQVGSPTDLIGTTLTGTAGLPGSPDATKGQTATAQNAPGFEVQEPFAEKMKRQQVDQALLFQQMKDARDRDIAAGKSDDAQKKMDLMYAIALSNAKDRNEQRGVTNDYKLQGAYERANKGPSDALDAYARMQQALQVLQDPNAPPANRSAAEAAIYEGNQKIVNPGVSVRAGQAKLYTDHQSAFQKLQVLVNNVVHGQGGALAPDTVQAFMDTAKRTIQPAVAAYKDNRQRFAAKASDPDFVVGGYDRAKDFELPPAGQAPLGQAPAAGRFSIVSVK